VPVLRTAVLFLLLLSTGPGSELSALRVQGPALSLAASGPAIPPVIPTAPAAAKPVAMFNGENLHDPTTTSVTLTLVPAESCELVVDYGPLPELALRTAALAVSGGELATFVLGGLEADGEFGYRVSVRRVGEPWLARGEHRFRTLRSPGATFHFGVIGDTHAWGVWSRQFCPRRSGEGEYGPLLRTLDSLRDDASLDFVVGGTDHAMTTCGACKACVLDSGARVSAGNARSLLDANLRYRTLFSDSLYGRFGADLPLLFMKGDHDGERGWSGEGQTCTHAAELARWSEQARLSHLPNPYEAYGAGVDGGRGGDETGSYYALETGDLLLVVLDPLRYTAEAPLTADNWTLGDEQLQWLDRTLADSEATFKIVFIEHVLGGNNDPRFACWKGRGALKATTTGEINAPFAGEQFIVHEMLKQHGAQVFFSFHDHVVVWGEKVDEDFVGEGVTYVTGGRASGVGAKWADMRWYKKAMDYDGDGVPEYQTNRTGTRRVGWFKVSVHGGERMEFAYLQSEGEVGERVLGFTITP